MSPVTPQTKYEDAHMMLRKRHSYGVRAPNSGILATTYYMYKYGSLCMGSWKGILEGLFKAFLCPSGHSYGVQTLVSAFAQHIDYTPSHQCKHVHKYRMHNNPDYTENVKRTTDENTSISALMNQQSYT